MRKTNIALSSLSSNLSAVKNIYVGAKASLLDSWSICDYAKNSIAV